MRERLLRYGRLAGFPAFYVLCLAIFAPLTFPYDMLKERIAFSFNDDQRATGGQQELRIESLGGYWLSGVRMKGVQLLSASSEPGKPPTKIEIDEATVRYSILSAMVGSGDVDFSADAFGGEVTGSYDTHGKDKSLEATLDGIDLGKVTPLSMESWPGPFAYRSPRGGPRRPVVACRSSRETLQSAMGWPSSKALSRCPDSMSARLP
jgi:type II secretion system protein N